MEKWAKNLARTLLPLDGRWVLDETSENEEASGGPEPILVSEIEPGEKGLLRILPLLSLLGALAQREWNLKNNECSMHKC